MNGSGTISPIAGGEGVHTFPKCICAKVKVIAPLEDGLPYHDSTVHRFNHYTTRTALVLIEPHQVLPLRTRADLEAMAIKGYSVFPKTPALLKFTVR